MPCVAFAIRKLANTYMNKKEIKIRLKMIAEELEHLHAWRARLKRMQKKLQAALLKAA